MRGAQWRRLVLRYPVSVIAQRVGRKEATVKRWIKQGHSPANVDTALASLADLRRPARVDVTRALRVFRAAELAKRAGVKEAVARDWKRKGNIPLQFRAFLYEQAQEPFNSELGASQVVSKSGRKWDLVTIDIGLGEITLSVESLLFVLDTIKATLLQYARPNSFYQAAIIGETPLYAGDVTWTTKTPDDVKELMWLDADRKLFEIGKWSDVYKTPEPVIESLHRKVEPMYQYTFIMKTAVILIRTKR